MPKVSTQGRIDRSSGGSRVFADHVGRVWNATDAGGAVMFTCISDGRESARAIAEGLSLLDEDIDDGTLRAWLDAAPRIGRLT